MRLKKSCIRFKSLKQNNATFVINLFTVKSLLEKTKTVILGSKTGF